jgi:hypothetical protein
MGVRLHDPRYAFVLRDLRRQRSMNRKYCSATGIALWQRGQLPKRRPEGIFFDTKRTHEL